MRSLRPAFVRPAVALAACLAPLAGSCTNQEAPKAPITNGAAASAPGSTARSSATTARPSGGTVAPSKPDAVSIQDYAFNPSPVPLKVGATATWTNAETEPPVEHWVKSDPGQAAEFDSGKLAPNASYGFTFVAPGEYSYYCAIHDFMKGKIVVTP